MPVQTDELNRIKGVFYNDSMDITVRSFGALGNGVHDDTEAIQTAINAAYSAGGGTVFVPTGTYIINPSIGLQVKSNVHLIGTGKGSILKISNSKNTSGNLVRIESWSNVTVADIVLDGNKSSQSSGTNYGLYAGGSANCRIKNVVTKNFTGVGVHIYNSNGIVVSDCLSTGNTYHGFEAEQISGCTFKGNRGSSNSLHGLLISPGEVGGTGSVGNTFIGNIFDSNSQYGIGANAANGDVSAWLCRGNLIQANSVYANQQYGIQIYKQDGFIISGNFIYNNKYFGVYLYQAQNCVVQGNILMNNSQQSNGAYDEIMLEGYTDNNSHPSKNNSVSGNTIIITATNRSRYAVNEASTGDGPNTIINNTVPASGATGTIHAQNATTITSQPAGVVQVADSGQAIQGALAGIDTAFSHVMRLYNNFASGETQVVNPNGAVTFYVGGSKRAEIATNGYVKTSAPNSAPSLSDNSTISFYLDEVGNNLKVAVKYSSGTTKTGSVALS